MFTDLPNLLYKACATVNTSIFLFGHIKLTPSDKLALILGFAYLMQIPIFFIVFYTVA
jgi:hypothetical protein